MRLSDKEAKVLAAVELSADLGMVEIRALTGFRDHTIRYAISKLEERNIIKRLPFINLAALGYQIHNIFFSLGSENEKLKQKIVTALQESEEVTWIAEMGSDFQFGIDVCVRSIQGVRKLLDSLTEKHGNIFYQKTISTQFSASLLPRGYLANLKKGPKSLTIEPYDEVVEIDDLDCRILAGLSEYGDVSHRKVASALGVPLSTFELRVSKLKEKKVLLGSFYSVDSNRFGMNSYKLLLFAKGVDPELRKRVRDFAEKHRNAVSLIECFGSWDYEIGVEVLSPQDVVAITQEVYRELGDGIISVKAFSMFRSLKTVLFPI